MTFIVFDIGGTNMRIAVATKDAVEEIKKVPTPQDLTETIERLTEIAHTIAPGGFERAAGCIPGQIDAERGVYDANNRKHWAGRHFDTELATALGVPVAIANDCAVIGLAEYHVGAGKGAQKMAYVTVSTGVGAALITNGKITPTIGFHFGHLEVTGEELENVISGTAVTKKFGIHPKDLDSLDERNKLGDILSEALMILRNEWQPDTIVLGGSMIVGKNPIPLERVREVMATSANAPKIVMAALGDNGGLEGGRILAAQQSLTK